MACFVVLVAIFKDLTVDCNILVATNYSIFIELFFVVLWLANSCAVRKMLLNYLRFIGHIGTFVMSATNTVAQLDYDKVNQRS